LRRPLTYARAGHLCHCAFKHFCCGCQAVWRLDLHALQSIANTATRLQWQTRGESAAYRIDVNLRVCCCRGRRCEENAVFSAQYPLPQSPQDPITLLTGRGHYTITGDCPFDSDFESRVERSGD
jgi:hypothetical protein